ncbi:hypothetical protein TSUD_85830 [Trifolium subterraneum]|uniref:Retrotransposon Copia-like N-terminal domain-containing protein n=1 Tax=Trifolium subterraneum TaxID=3900 RepID=A0A2Z6PJQ5_TRISU|nr:hypothetical protein TSUD_85830 [Trifolium subterraneum]
MLPPPPISIYKAKVSVKLDEEKDNFLIWRQLVELVIKGHRLHMFLTRSTIRHNAGSSNNDFDEKDQILFSWILSTLAESMLARVIGCANSKQLWEKLHSFFKNRARAKVKKVQNNRESDEYDRQNQLSFNRDIFSRSQPTIPPPPLTNSFSQQFLPYQQINPSNVAAAAASNIRYSSPVWTSSVPHTHSSFHAPMNMRPPMTMSPEPQNYGPIAATPLNYVSATANITNQTTDLSLYAPPN